MGLFKKNCFHCGQNLGLFGGTKIANVDFCNSCHNQFLTNSNLPYLNRIQFNYPNRVSEFIDFAEKNKRQFQLFNSTRCFNEKDSLYIDENQCLFYVVTSLHPTNGIAPIIPKKQGLFSFLTEDIDDEENEYKIMMPNVNLSRQLSTPIVLHCKSITDIKLDIQEKKLENSRSDILSKVINAFNPTYTFSYNYYVNISLNHCWVSNIKLQLNPTDIVVTITQKKGIPLINPREQSADCRNCERVAEDIKAVLENLRMDSPVYYKNISSEQYTTSAVQHVNKVPRTVAIKCPYCGAPSIAYEGTTIKCEYCGMYLDA